MSGSAAKANRRQIVRALGPAAVGAIEEAQQNILALSASLTQAHQRIDQLNEQVREVSQDKDRQMSDVWTEVRRWNGPRSLWNRTFLGRLRWLVTGR